MFSHYNSSYDRCTYCGYLTACTCAPACTHPSYTTTWVTSCQWERYCSSCGAYLGSGTTHGPYTYGSWTYYSTSQHRRSYTCSYSLSVSDIVVLQQNGVVSCHYVDSWGFKEMPTFLPQQNYLKNAEMAMEDDYNQIDGIINNGKRETTDELEEKVKAGQPISLLAYVEAARRESKPQEAPKPTEKKPSVLTKLHTLSTENTMKSAPRKSAERELL